MSFKLVIHKPVSINNINDRAYYILSSLERTGFLLQNKQGDAIGVNEEELFKIFDLLYEEKRRCLKEN